MPGPDSRTINVFPGIVETETRRDKWVFKQDDVASKVLYAQ